MITLRLNAFCAVIVISAGCSPARVIVTAPDATVLASLSGKPVILEGKVTLRKAGYVLETTGPEIVLEYLGAKDRTWPTVGTCVQATGTLRVDKDPRLEYEFYLDHPQCKTVESPAR